MLQSFDHNIPEETLAARTVSDSILQRIAIGDPDAVQDCVDRYSGLVWSLARQFTPTAAEAEDAVQEIFINLWKHAGRFDPNVAAESTFVSMIARRRLIDRNRKASRRPSSVSISADNAPTLEMEQPLDQAETLQAQDEETARAMDALSQLKPEQQQVLHLSIGHGRTYEQIARITDMPVGTVKTHARRGLIRVREILAKQQSGSGSAAEVLP